MALKLQLVAARARRWKGDKRCTPKIGCVRDIFSQTYCLKLVLKQISIKQKSASYRN